MRIKELYTDSNTIIPVGNNYYNSREWFLQTYNLLDGLIKRTQGNRILYEDLETLDDVKAAVDDLLVFNRYKYDHLWKLYVAEYNPLWNVDGSEKTIRERVKSIEDIRREEVIADVWKRVSLLQHPRLP